MNLAAVAGQGGLVLLIGLPAAAVASRVGRIRSWAPVAMLQDATPLVLVLAWVGLVAAVVARSWLLAAVAVALCVYHVLLVVRLVLRRASPRWVSAAPTTKLALANVYVDNDEFDRAARQLLEVGADLLIVVETTPEFRAAFDRAGADERYPHRTFDPDDDSEYAVSLYSATAPTSIEMVDIGTLRAARAVLDVGGRPLHVVGAIPMAAVDPGGYDAWRRQIHDLGRYAAAHRGPLVVAGDLNTTIHRAAFRDLEAAGLVDAHDALGLGLRPSFKLAARGLLARLGPLVRLDHALLNDGVWAVEVDDLDSAGSDHRPFVATLAVRPADRRPAGHQPMSDLAARKPPSERRRVGVSALLGVVAGGGAVAVGPWQLAVLAGWDATALVLLAWIWSSIGSLDPEDTRRLATREDDSRVAARAVVVGGQSRRCAARHREGPPVRGRGRGGADGRLGRRRRAVLVRRAHRLHPALRPSVLRVRGRYRLPED